jgi:hypothetical protein
MLPQDAHPALRILTNLKGFFVDRGRAGCGAALKWVLPLDPEKGFLYISSERGLYYEEYIKNNGFV